jgi:hypothetical protein
LGDVERFCVTQCFVWADGWAERNGHEALAYILENRPHRSEANRRVFEFFRRYHEVTQEGPINKDISFELSSEKIPLQAADLVSWEYYQLGKGWLLTRDESKKRAHLQRLSEVKIMDVQFFSGANTSRQWSPTINSTIQLSHRLATCWSTVFLRCRPSCGNSRSAPSAGPKYPRRGHKSLELRPQLWFCFAGLCRPIREVGAAFALLSK